MFPCRTRHPAQVLQYNLVQNTLPDVVARAGFPVLLVGAAGKVIVAGGHGMRPVQHHVGAAVGTEHKTGVLVLFFHLAQTALVLPHSLYHVPDLPRNEGGMGILKDHAFLSWMLDPPFVLVGLRTVLHVDGVAQINFVFQQVGNGAVRPVIRVCGVQASMIHAESGVGVHGRRQDLLFLENAGNLAGTVATGAHGEDPTDDGCRFLIHD